MTTTNPYPWLIDNGDGTYGADLRACVPAVADMRLIIVQELSAGHIVLAATKPSDRERIRDAMRSGEWLRTQWIARVAFDERPPSVRTLRVLRGLLATGEAERRSVITRGRSGLPVPRWEWRASREKAP